MLTLQDVYSPQPSNTPADQTAALSAERGRLVGVGCFIPLEVVDASTEACFINGYFYPVGES